MEKTYSFIIVTIVLYMLYVWYSNRPKNTNIKGIKPKESKKDEMDIPIVSENKFDIDPSLFMSVEIDNIEKIDDINDVEILGFEDLLILSSNETFHALFMASLIQSLADKFEYYTNIINTTKPVVNTNHNDISENMTADNTLIENSKDILHTIKLIKDRIESGKFDIGRRLEVCITLMNKIVGRDTFKDLVSRDIIIFARAQRLFCNNFNNMVVCGDPGCGKSYCVGIVDKIYNLLGLTLRPHIVITMDNLKTGFVNESPRKTKKTLYNCLERIAFFDEAYILVSNDTMKSNSDEVVTTFVDMLSTYAGKINLIIAGYEKPMKTFLKANEGFDRRFPYNRRDVFTPYKASHLTGIFINAIIEMDNSVSFCNKSISYLFSLIKVNYDTFTNGAGDITNLSRIFIEFCYTNTYSMWIPNDYKNNKYLLTVFFAKNISSKLPQQQSHIY